MTFLQDPSFWVLVSFLIFLVAAIRFKAHHAVRNALEQQRKNVNDELDAASALRQQAHEALTLAQQQLNNVKNDADAVIADAEKRAETITQRAQHAAELAVARRRRDAELQIRRAVELAQTQLADHVAELAVNAASVIIKERSSHDDAREHAVKTAENVAQQFRP